MQLLFPIYLALYFYNVFGLSFEVLKTSVHKLSNPNKKPEPGPLLPFPSLRHVFYISKIQDGRPFFFFNSVQGVGGVEAGGV